MRIAIIDNEDSFTYNLSELIRKCTNSKPAIFNSQNFDISVISDMDFIIFSPGPGLPQDFPAMFEILNRYDDSKTILGICLGHQAICQYYGGELSNMANPVHGQSKEIIITENSKLFNGLPPIFNIGLYHSWLAKDNFDPNELLVTGILENGSIMSVRHKTKNVFGVQFHPESFITEYGYEIMMNFLK